MGKQLPDDLVEVLNLIGIDWPQIDEDEVKASAKDYRNLADGIRDAVKEGNNACSHIVAGKSKGETVTAIDRRWGKLTTRDLSTFAKGCDTLADALDDCADLVLGCKIAIIAKLSATAAAAGAGVVGMFFTVGLSGLLSAAAIAAARLIIQELIDTAVERITSIVTEKIEGKILAELEKLFTDRLGGGSTYDVMASGSSAMAQDLVIEFDEFERSASDYQKTATNFDKKKGDFKNGGSQRKTSVKKDSRFHKLATVMDKAEDTVEEKAHEMVKTLEDHGGKIDKSKREQREEDERRKKEFEKCKVDGDDDVRTYLLNADGSVQRLDESGRTSSLDTEDRTRLNGVVLNDGKAWIPSTPKEKSEFYADSQASGPDSVAEDRLRQPGRPGPGDASRQDRAGRLQGNQLRCRPVHRARREGVHPRRLQQQERALRTHDRTPTPAQRKGGNLTEVFTEREPCRKNPECARWLDFYFKQDLKVTHVADYYTPEGKTTNTEHTKYLDHVKKLHGK
ncbi:nucleic acid/nucleotide deaminase domain-containing protein [Streptomyces microflavus]